MSLPLTISCSSKSRLVLPSWFLPFWYLLTRVVPDKFHKSSKTVVCACVCVRACVRYVDRCMTSSYSILKCITISGAIQHGGGRHFREKTNPYPRNAKNIICPADTLHALLYSHPIPVFWLEQIGALQIGYVLYCIVYFRCNPTWPCRIKFLRWKWSVELQLWLLMTHSCLCCYVSFQCSVSSSKLVQLVVAILGLWMVYCYVSPAYDRGH